MSTTTLRSFSMSSMEEDTPVMEDRRQVVVAMDGSDHSLYALNWFKENIHKKNDYVYIVHSVEWQHVLHNSKWHYSPQHNNTDAVGPLMKEEHSIVQNRLDHFNQELNRLQIDGVVKPVHSKNPGEGVIQESIEVNANLIVTGTRGHGKIRRTILGSVSDYILHHSSVPVIICHHKEKH